MDSKTLKKEPKSRRLPTRSYSMSLQTPEFDLYPSKWTSKELLPTSRGDTLPSLSYQRGVTLPSLSNQRGVTLPSLSKQRGETLPSLYKQRGETLPSLSKDRGETLPSLSKQIQTSPSRKRPNVKQKREKRARKSGVENPGTLQVVDPESEIERFEREFVKPMLDSRRLLDKMKSSDDLRTGAKMEEHNTSLPTIHLQQPEDRHTDFQSLPEPSIRDLYAGKLVPEDLAELPGSSVDERVPSSSHSLVSDSNYDSGKEPLAH